MKKIKIEDLGPLRVMVPNYPHIVYLEGGNYVADCGPGLPLSNDEEEPYRWAWARRIAAALNFVQGYETEVLEKGPDLGEILSLALTETELKTLEETLAGMGNLVHLAEDEEELLRKLRKLVKRHLENH